MFGLFFLGIGTLDHSIRSCSSDWIKGYIYQVMLSNDKCNRTRHDGPRVVGGIASGRLSGSFGGDLLPVRWRFDAVAVSERSVGRRGCRRGGTGDRSSRPRARPLSGRRRDGPYGDRGAIGWAGRGAFVLVRGDVRARGRRRDRRCRDHGGRPIRRERRTTPSRGTKTEKKRRRRPTEKNGAARED